jgi:hypothetical protein
MKNGFDFDRAVADYLNRFKKDGDDGRVGDMKVHASEVGYCPRKMAYRMLGAPSKPLTAQKIKMFNLAHHLHFIFCKGLEYKGLLYDSEVDLSESMPEGVTGRYDYRRRLEPGKDDVLRLGDIKTSHPNIIKYTNTLPKVEAVVQVSIYHAFHFDQERLDPMAEALYNDRGGQNPSVLCEFTPLGREQVLDEWLAPYFTIRAQLLDFIGERPLSEVRNHIDEAPLPDVLLPELKWSYRNKQYGGGDVSFGVPWSCGKSYCQYTQCPNWGKRTRKVLKVNKTYGYQWTPLGRKLMRKNPERFGNFLFPRTVEQRLALLLDSINVPDAGSQWDDNADKWISKSDEHKSFEKGTAKMGLPEDEVFVDEAAKLTGHEVVRTEAEGDPDVQAPEVFGD